MIKNEYYFCYIAIYSAVNIFIKGINLHKYSL